MACDTAAIDSRGDGWLVFGNCCAHNLEEMPVTDSHTEPDEATISEQKSEAGAAHVADRLPTPEEEAAADSELADSDEKERSDVAAHEQEMNELGANAKGEGRID
jgi:hypothetical protein